MGAHGVGCVHCEAGQSQGIQKPYFLAGPEEPPSWPNYWLGGRWTNTQAVHYSAGGNKVALGLGPL